MDHPRGFLFNAVQAGLKKDALDLGLVFCARQATCAGVFTTNLVQAAPVVLGRELVARGRARAILVNSGCANACTGDQGLADARGLLEAAAQILDTAPEEILPASTGVIGERLPVERMKRALPELAAGLAPERAPLVARAMMTTDTFPKVATRRLEVRGGEVRLLGLAKGAGMIAPHMATMLAFVLTDAALRAEDLQGMLSRAVEVSFNRITVDGDTSTNDTVYALASGEVPLSPAEHASFARELGELCRELARLIVKDGEGATKLVRIRVEGAATEEAALKLAQTVANSPLVKTAFFGEDPNWGRVLAAMGRSGVRFDPRAVDLYVEGVRIVERGLGAGREAEQRAHEIMKGSEFSLTIRLFEGEGQAEVLTCDFSYDYIKINAEYRT